METRSPSPDLPAENRALPPRSRGAISVTYQLFIILITINALVVMAAFYVLPVPVEVKQVLYILDSLNAFILLGDFFYRLVRAPNRLRYLISLGWLDLIGGLPGLPILRLARVPTLVALVKLVNRETPDEVRQDARRSLASSTLLSTVLIVLVVVTVGSILIVLVESNASDGNILTGEDAVWWSIVTIATVGYGDRYPTTPVGRLIGVAMIIMGVSLFSVLTSFIATGFVSRRRSVDQKGEADALRDEIVQILAEQRRSAGQEAAALNEEIAQLRQLLNERLPPASE
jgi:voltage-gated potassium channel